MKTYTRTVTETKPRLVIQYDRHLENPRTNQDNLGLFITKEYNSNSPDGKDNDAYKAMIDADYLAKDPLHHARLIQRAVGALAVYPVHKYDHGSVVYKLGTAEGWDISQCGFYVVTKEGANNLGTPPKFYRRVIEQELDEYSKWCNGEVYEFTLYDEKGLIESSCAGFYDIEDIREFLLEEWKNENLRDYIT